MSAARHVSSSSFCKVIIKLLNKKPAFLKNIILLFMRIINFNFFIIHE